ncbi:MAG TPA: glycosyltransferase [Candidatus Angelobacter sp.]|nr:glycosyltransferase [Candidatus Angelobacter sp.]
MTSPRRDEIYSRKLRIAICGGRGIPSTYSGTETFFVELAPRLAARGHHVTVYCRRSLYSEQPELYQGVHLVYLPSIETKNLGTFTHTLACMVNVVRRDVDAVLVTNVANALHCLIPRIFGKNCALNVDGIEWKRGKWGPLGKAYFYINARLSGKILPRGIVTDAYGMRRLYREKFNTPSVCIAYGGNTGASSNPEVVRQYGLEPGAYYLILSRLVPENSADMIVNGFKNSASQRLLAIVGDANYRSHFEAQLRAIAGDRVRFLGHVDNREHVRELYCNSYAYIHGHTVGGTNPSLLHALGYGCCVLARANEFNAEVLDGHGILFNDGADLAQKIAFIEANPAVAGDYRQRGPERIHAVYNWDRITDQYEEFFYQLAAGEDPTRVHSSVKTAERELSATSG